MKFLITFLVVLLAQPKAVAQKTYSFDSLLEYEFRKTESSPPKKAYFLANSKDNSYVLEAVERDSLKLTLYFTDQNGIRSVTNLDKKSFLGIKSLPLPCVYVSRYKNPDKEMVSEYSFLHDKDTVVSGISGDVYVLKADDRKRERRKKLGTAVYVIDRSQSSQLPLLPFATAYEEWKAEKSIPNGIPRLMFLKSYKSKRSTIYVLKKVSEVSRSVVIPSDCDYTAEKQKSKNSK
jgi:hypothetical protein